MKIFLKRLHKPVTITLTLILLVGTASAGLTVTRSNGIAVTGADGVSFLNPSGIAVTGADGVLSCTPNGIAVTGADGIAVTGADGTTYTGPNGLITAHANSMNVNGADGIAVTGADGIAVTGADGQTIHADSLLIRQANGIAVTGADSLRLIGVDGIAVTGADAFNAVRSNGIAVTGADGIAVTGADGIAVTGADGRVYSISPNGIAVTGADSIYCAYATGIAVTGADGIAVTGADGIAVTGADATPPVGLQSVDPELALQLNQLTDDSNVNAVVVYHHLPTDADLADLLQLGVASGTRYRSLPMIALTATKQQLITISHLTAVRSIYGNRTLQFNSDPYLSLNCATRIPVDRDLTRNNQGMPVSGNNVTVAVLDTGVDGTHADLAGRVIQNVKLLDPQSVSPGFVNPVGIENVPNTDQAYGHGTFVAGVIAGNGARSGSRYAGLAPGARIVGLSAGDLTLSFVLSGFDYLLTSGDNLNVRVVNCSFSANTVFDYNDPVNVATRLLTDHGVNVVFSAGNTGPGLHSLNPYAVAPWVVSVGATDQRGRLADFSSRGAFASNLFHPTLVAPGVSVISLRAFGVTGVVGAAQADTQRLAPADVPYYTTASGTSFSAPQVAAVIAMMLEVNPRLTPDGVRDILQRTATPLAPYYQHEVGAGMLNAHAAVLEAADAARRFGVWRATLNKGYVQFINDPAQTFSGTVTPGGTIETSLTIPQNTLLASTTIAWGPMWSTNDLGLTMLDARGVQQGASDALNLPGLTGKREAVVVAQPSAGVWRARATSSRLLSTSSQSFTGVTEITRAQYAPINDLNSMSATARAEIYQMIRTRAMTPFGNNFRPTFNVTRAALAEAMVYGARVPQYLAAQPRYSDVRDLTTRSFVESAQFNSSSALFPDDSSNRFRPDDLVDRLTATVVLVRAAGLRAQAESQNNAPLALVDALLIPAALRGYVAVALSQGLLNTDGNAFRPQNTLTRVELAHALATIQRLASQ
jgi:serine protease AprX